jgi:hypothetical protein
MTTNLRAASAVARYVRESGHAPSTNEARAIRREFYEMLGLIDDAGHLTPDETRSLPLEVPAAAIAQREPTSVQWWTDKPEVSTAPEALRNLASVVQQPAVQPVKAPTVRVRRVSTVKPVTRVAVAKCGTTSGYKRHRKNGETSCQPCREAHNADTRRYNASRPPRPQVTRAQCGTPLGREMHRRKKERACDDCKEAAK